MPKGLPAIIGVGGFASNVGKTSLLCELLRLFPGWEAIKTTRGHYRSCGKDPHSCCVSHLLGDEPLVRSGRAQTYARDKDTGRYWEAGAANVHWVIATNEQVEQGIVEALKLVSSAGVFIEGNSYSEFVKPDFMIMVARAAVAPVKKSARIALARCSAIFLTGENSLQANHAEQEHFQEWLRARLGEAAAVQVYTWYDLPGLLDAVRSARSLVAA